MPAKPPPPPISASIRAFGLKATSVPIIARDFSLGPLQSYRPAAGDETEVFKVARAFADGLVAGKLDTQLLLPEARDALAILLAPPEPAAGSAATTPYRLGAILLQDSAASLRLRLPGEIGAARIEGLLSLRKAGDTWYVEALALDAPSTEALAFNPDSSALPR